MEWHHRLAGVWGTAPVSVIWSGPGGIRGRRRQRNVYERRRPELGTLHRLVRENQQTLYAAVEQVLRSAAAGVRAPRVRGLHRLRGTLTASRSARRATRRCCDRGAYLRTASASLQDESYLVLRLVEYAASRASIAVPRDRVAAVLTRRHVACRVQPTGARSRSCEGDLVIRRPGARLCGDVSMRGLGAEIADVGQSH
jgi:hypothetical protein